MAYNKKGNKFSALVYIIIVEYSNIMFVSVHSKSLYKYYVVILFTVFNKANHLGKHINRCYRNEQVKWLDFILN